MPSDLFVVGVPLGSWQTNCYLVGDLNTSRCAVIDPGQGGLETVPPLLEQLGVTCEAILVTHGHIDHFWSVPDLADQLDVPVHAHPDDQWLWENPLAGIGGPPQGGLELLRERMGLDWRNPKERLVDVADNDKLTVAGVDYVVRHTPGHTPGHVTFLGQRLEGAQVQFSLGNQGDPAGDVLFSGDLIFAGSVGRTDFPRGDARQLLQSINDTVLPLEDDTLILSGHGPDTTVGRERATNPFVAQARGM